MYFAIFDSTGNLVESFTAEDEALHALEGMVHADDDAGDHLALITFDENGTPVGEARTAADIGAAA